MDGFTNRQSASEMLLVAALIAVMIAGGSTNVVAEGRARIIEYTSPVDNSQQAYGVYIPQGSAPADGYPVVLHGHGYGWRVSRGFLGWQKNWADAHRWLLVRLNARGPNFYWGIGDVATKEVIDDLEMRFGIDERRLYITGGSMGGTGAYRQGIVHPDYIAASVGVDGWTDFHKWHHHWYARKDQRDDIEEFRRPLLVASSPLFIAERAMWGDVHVIADKKDTVVLPQQGIDLGQRLKKLSETKAGTYDSGLTVNPNKGHGGGHDTSWIYNYFQGRTLQPDGEHFVIATPVLDHGEMYRGRMEKLHHQGQMARLECSLQVRGWDELDRALGHPRLPEGIGPPKIKFPPSGSLLKMLKARKKAGGDVGVIHVRCQNLDAFSLKTSLSRVADLQWIAVYADGIPCYLGAPQELMFEAIRDGEGRLTGWSAFVLNGRDEGQQRQLAVNPAAGKPVHALSKSRRRWPPRKSCEIGGPIGDAFTEPFIVCYGDIGPEKMQKRHRKEAEAFCKGWNEFMVHGRALRAIPETELTPRQMKQRNLIIYGTLDTSRILKQAHGAHPLPVRVYEDRIMVRDPLTGDREYRGKKFGTFFAYPNPLTAGRTYIVVCNRRFATKPQGGRLKGLEYDLEKLYWAYSDYVIFDSDQADLPHVKNVNNKPPVTCYEAGYFVEAGYFDENWRPNRWVTIDRVKRTKPEDVRLIHVADVTVTHTDRSFPVFEKIDGEPKDPAREKITNRRLCAKVRVVDSDGDPVRQARVTGEWVGCDAETVCRPTLSNGIAWLPYPEKKVPHRPTFRVLNVMATGAAYDFEKDCLRGSRRVSADGKLALRPVPVRRACAVGSRTEVEYEVANLSRRAANVTVRFVPPNGELKDGTDELRLAAGEKQSGTFDWQPDRSNGRGTCRGLLIASMAGSSVRRPVQFRLYETAGDPLSIPIVEAEDIYRTEDYEITAFVHNGTDREIEATVTCAIAGAEKLPAAKTIRVEPGGLQKLLWNSSSAEHDLSVGKHEAVVTILGGAGNSKCASFEVK